MIAYEVKYCEDGDRPDFCLNYEIEKLLRAEAEMEWQYGYAFDLDSYLA